MTHGVVRHSVRALVALAALAFGVGMTAISQAAPKSTPPLRVQAAASAPTVMTREQLRDCMLRHDDLVRRNDAMPARVDALNAEAKALEDTNQQLRAIKSRMSERAERVVEDYNQATQDYNLRLGALKAGQQDYDRDARQLDADQTAFNAACTGRQYLQADYDAVMQERPAAPAASAPH